MDKGLTHIYFGNGKGKTTTAMGLSMRAAGYGYKVLIYQFMKNNHSSERKILSQIDNITILDGLGEEKFSWQLSEEEKKERIGFYESQLQMIIQKVIEEKYDVLFLDEIIYTIEAGLLSENSVLQFLKEKPTHLEVILTGNTPSEEMIGQADYVSEICKRKHPYDKGEAARYGIEK